MKSSVIVAKHPLHPMLIPIPVAGFLFALIGDLAYLGTQNPFWQSFAAWTMGLGIIGGLLAAIPGLVDYLTVVPPEAKRDATIHMILNFGIVTLFGVNLALRLLTDASSGAPLWTAVGLTVAGNLTLLYSAWLGGELAYHHRIGVEEPGKPAPEVFRVTLSPEERAKVRK